MVEMLTTGKAGLLAGMHYLETTSNNIANVSTEGYTRQQTIYYTSVVDWGIGSSYTRRIYNEYVQSELFRDIGDEAYYEAYLEGMETVDAMLSEDSMSISTQLDTLYESLQDAIQNPTSSAYREELLVGFEDLVVRFNTLNEEIAEWLSDINAQVYDTVDEINTLVQSIQEILVDINSVNETTDSDIYLQMLDERDQLITQLAELVDIQCKTEDDGTMSVYLGNGQLLVNESTYVTLVATQDDYVSNKLNILLVFNDRNETTIEYDWDDFGGQLGGYLAAGVELRQTMRDLGQLAVAFSDAINEQNATGMTLEGTAGEDILTYDTVVYGTSSNSDFTITCNFIDGLGSNVVADDFMVEVLVDGTVTVYRVEQEEEIDITDEVEITTDEDGNLFINLESYGITLSFNASAETIAAAQNRKTTFYVQPTINQGYVLEVNATKAEDFAFAAAVRVNTGSDNYGDAVITLESMTEVGEEYGVSVDETTGEFVMNTYCPASIVIDADGNYEIYSADGTYLGEASADTDGQNIFANAVWDTTVVGENYDPGFEVSITGTVSEDDYFEIELNTEGYSDNTNGLLMGLLWEEDLVAISSSTTKQSFVEDYAELTSRLGSAVLSATNSYEAATAKLEQTQELYDSSAGVSLDEEAANLVRYQQIYTACSKIITASQDCFDALIAAVG